jgi:hypothetical protein
MKNERYLGNGVSEQIHGLSARIWGLIQFDGTLTLKPNMSAAMLSELSLMMA